MKTHLESTLLALMCVAIAGISWAQEPPASERTRTQTAASEQGQSEEQQIKECVEQLKERNSGITDYSARKACRNHVEDQADRSSEG